MIYDILKGIDYLSDQIIYSFFWFPYIIYHYNLFSWEHFSQFQNVLLT